MPKFSVVKMSEESFDAHGDLQIKRALVSVTDKTGIVGLARGLEEHGVEIISTGGTLGVLQNGGVKAIPVEEVTKFPEMLDGRVKTLHPNLFAGMLANKSDPEHMKTISERGIQPIDMVVCNFYSFSTVAAKIGVTMEELVENIDIGGPSMVMAAAKNHNSVLVVTSPADYPKIAAELDVKGGKVSFETRWQGFLGAINAVADYRSSIASTFNELQRKDTQAKRHVKG